MKKLTLLCFLFASTQIHAGIATVLFTSNKVTSASGSPITRGASLSAGDAVITAADSVANIKYNNGTLVNIGANSNYKILDYAPNQIKSELSTGDIHTKTNGKTKETVKTPVVALAVLGTEFQLGVHCKGGMVSENCKSVVNLQVIEGMIQAGSTILKAGSSVVINSPSSVKPAVFPAAMQVKTPVGAAGSISSSTSSSSDNQSSYNASTAAVSSVSLNSVQTTSAATTTTTTATVRPFVPGPPPIPPIPPLLPPVFGSAG